MPSPKLGGGHAAARVQHFLGDAAVSWALAARISPYGDDPAGAGLVASLAHPGGNVTGFLAYTGPEFG